MSTFAIISQESNNGAISPLGTTNVTLGQDQAYTITASTGYQIDSVWADGVNQGAVSTFTFPAVAATHTIVAIFAISGGYYCTQQDLINMIGMKRLAQISNDTANATVPDPVIVMDKIAEAWNYLNAELDGTFAVPLTPTPGIIHDLSVKVAIYNLFLRSFSIMTMPKEWDTKYKEVVDQIGKITSLEIGLDTTLYPITAPESQMEKHRMFSHHEERRFHNY